MNEVNERFGVLADQARIDKTVAALAENGVEATVVADGAAAKQKLRELIPEGVEIMNMTSMTLETIDAAKEINESGRYDSARNRLTEMDRAAQADEMRKLGAAPQWAVGSVHAVTEDGKVFIASATGSQLPAYAYGSGKVVWVVGAQKLVKDFNEAIERLYEYSFPLEDARARRAYGIGSGVHKILIINKEVRPDRITMIIVKEKLGF